MFRNTKKVYRGGRMLEQKVPTQWLALYRDFAMPGGIWDIGMLKPIGIYNTYEEAKQEAIEYYETLPEELVDPRVWICRVESSLVKTSEGRALLISDDSMLEPQ